MIHIGLSPTVGRAPKRLNFGCSSATAMVGSENPWRSPHQSGYIPLGKQVIWWLLAGWIIQHSWLAAIHPWLVDDSLGDEILPFMAFKAIFHGINITRGRSYYPNYPSGIQPWQLEIHSKSGFSGFLARKIIFQQALAMITPEGIGDCNHPTRESRSTNGHSSFSPWPF